MTRPHTTLLVIGGGPGGYVAAIRAARLGVPTTLVEAGALGGTCLNVGCIPSKALIHAAGLFWQARRFALDHPLGIRAAPPTLDLAQTQGWKAGIVRRLRDGVATLLRKAGVQVVHGHATLLDGKTVEVVPHDGPAMHLQCEHLLLTTGSEPVALPCLPFGGPVVDAAGALAFDTVPRQLVVVGAGYIGLELGMAWRKLGAEVTVVEAASHILPAHDEELSAPVLQQLRRLGVTLHLGCSVQGLSDDGQLRVRSSRADEFALPADRVLVAVGRRPRTQGYGLERLQLAMRGGAVQVDDQCRTSMRHVWAIGDLTGEPMLAHRAMAQGTVVAERVAGIKRRFQPLAIPAVCFTDPELVVVGRTPAEAEAEGMDVTVAAFPLAANGRALSLEAPEGFVRVVARRDTRQILGWQAVGTGVSELGAAFAYAVEMGALLDDVGAIIHAHPTLGEAVQEAALRAMGQALHV